MREPSAVVLSSLLTAHLRSPHTPCPHSPSLHVPSTSPLRLTLCFSLFLRILSSLIPLPSLPTPFFLILSYISSHIPSPLLFTHFLLLSPSFTFPSLSLFPSPFLPLLPFPSSHLPSSVHIRVRTNKPFIDSLTLCTILKCYNNIYREHKRRTAYGV